MKALIFTGCGCSKMIEVQEPPSPRVILPVYYRHKYDIYQEDRPINANDIVMQNRHFELLGVRDSEFLGKHALYQEIY